MSLHQEIMLQYETSLNRLNEGGDSKSYTCYLYKAGIDKILKKCGEEAFETAVAAKNEDKEDLVGEINDVLYHVTVMMCYRGVAMERVLEILNETCKTCGLELDALYHAIVERKENPTEGSYTAYLFEQGLDKVLKKVGEAVSLIIIEAKNDAKEPIAAQVADLIYHLFVMMIIKKVSCEDLEGELLVRRGKTGNLKEFHTTDKTT